MKKTIITILALAGVAMADGTLLWTLDASNGAYNLTTTNAYAGSNLATNWGSQDFETMPGYVYANGDKKISVENAMGLKMADSFTLTMNCNLTGNVHSAALDEYWLMSVGENGKWDLGVAYDVATGAVTIATDESNYTISDVTTYGTYVLSDIKSVTLTLAGGLDEAGSVTIYVNGAKAAEGTMAAGNRHTNTTIKGAVFLNGLAEHKGVVGGLASASFYSGVVAPSANIPEPATATLSLLALAGLCARRRRG